MVSGRTTYATFEMAYLVHNEKTKTSAALLNTLAVACIVVGAVTPVAAIGIGGDNRLESWNMDRIYWIVPTWLIVGMVLHWGSRSLLGRLRE
jgi:hypothetical protein